MAVAVAMPGSYASSPAVHGETTKNGVVGTKGYQAIRNAHGDSCLTTDSDGTVIVTSCRSDQRDAWRFVPTDKAGEFRIKKRGGSANGQCLTELFVGSTTDEVILLRCSKRPVTAKTQTWEVRQSTSRPKYLRIANANSGQVLSLGGPRAGDVQTARPGGTDHRFWVQGRFLPK